MKMIIDKNDGFGGIMNGLMGKEEVGLNWGD